MAASPDLQRLEQEVEESRARLANTLDRLTSPETAEAVKNEVMGYVQGLKNEVLGQMHKTKDDLLNQARDTGRQKARGFANDLKERALANPLGVLLIGAGVAWRLYKHPPITTLLVGAGLATFLADRGRKQADHRAYRAPYDPDRPRGYVPGGVAGYGYSADDEASDSGMADRISASASRTGEMAREAGERAREAAHSAASRLSDAAATARSAASGIADRTASDLHDAAQHTMRRAGSIVEQVRGDPVALGALGLGIGAAIGHAVRTTATGDRLARGTTRAFARGARGVASGVGSAARMSADAMGAAAHARRRAPAGMDWIERELFAVGQRYPLLLGAVGLAAGAALGVSLHSTRLEHRVMGPLSDTVRRRAREMAGEQYGQIRETAEHFASDLRTRFETHGRPDGPVGDRDSAVGDGATSVASGEGQAGLGSRRAQETRGTAKGTPELRR